MEIRIRTVPEATVSAAHSNTIYGEECLARVQDRNDYCRTGLMSHSYLLGPSLQLMYFPSLALKPRWPSNHHHSADKVPSCPSYGFSRSHVWIWELDHKEVWVSKKWFFPAVVLEKTLEISLDKWGDQTRQSWRKSTLNIYWKDWCWIWSANTLVTWCEEPSHLERHWCRERLKAEGNDRGWDGWMAPPTPWTWVWASSGHSEGQGGLACCSLWGHKESDMTAWLNNNNNTLTTLASGEQ